MPAKLVADTRTAAGEINARRQDVDNRHRDADVEIKRLQAEVEQAPQRGATAANTLADVGREQTIRASQPASQPAGRSPATGTGNGRSSALAAGRGAADTHGAAAGRGGVAGWPEQDTGPGPGSRNRALKTETPRLLWGVSHQPERGLGLLDRRPIQPCILSDASDAARCSVVFSSW